MGKLLNQQRSFIIRVDNFLNLIFICFRVNFYLFKLQQVLKYYETMVTVSLSCDFLKKKNDAKS